MQRRRLLMMDSSKAYTVTGNPVSFETNLAKPLKGMVISFTPIQAGTGDPSPSNVRSISGWDGLTIYHSGQDTSNPSTYPVAFPADPGTIYGGYVDLAQGVVVAEWECKKIKDFTVSYDVTTWNGRIALTTNSITETGNHFDADIYCSSYTPKSSGISTSNNVITHYNKYLYIRDESYSDKDSFLAAMGDEQIAFQLATPITYPLSSVIPTTLNGQNVIWTDTNGTNTVTYLKRG